VNKYNRETCLEVFLLSAEVKNSSELERKDHIEMKSSVLESCFNLGTNGCINFELVFISLQAYKFY
jgi:hypothetical protein